MISYLFIILKGFIKQRVIKQSPIFLNFLFLFSYYQSCSKFWKIDKISGIKMEKI